MNSPTNTLLPSGLYDLLPPDARKESDAVGRLLFVFRSFGYAQVRPPLLEFESTLLQGRGETLASQTFRVIDPLSQTMMGFRPDMTLQVARIAKTRMASEPRPLRLCYAGSILRVKPEALKSERQLMQTGIELIGANSVGADAEVILVAVEGLRALGINDISIDINLPGLLSELCPEARNQPALQATLKDAITRRDEGMIKTLPIKNAKLLSTLMDAAGPAKKTLAIMEPLSLSVTARLSSLIALVSRDCPEVTLTIDPLEYRGFDYHQGIGFSLFAKGLRHELGRGGSYKAGDEDATGFSVYVTHLLSLLAEPKKEKRVLIARDGDYTKAAELRAEGWHTIYATGDEAKAEAKRQNCTHIVTKQTMETV